MDRRFWLIGIVSLLLVGYVGSAAGQTVYTLSECVGIALEGSPSLAISAANTDVAKHGLRQAKGAFLPDLSLYITWIKSERIDFLIS